MNSKGKIYGVSLGPGDPLLITVKGMQTLQQADKIYYPGSLLADGSTSSYSLQILQHYQLDTDKLHGMFLKMSDDREVAEQTYAATFQEMLADYQTGLQIAFVSEGDISFYSTFAYLLKHIQQHQLELEIIAGVPSFILGAAQHQSSLAILNEKIAILPRMKDRDTLSRYLEEFETVVLIKVRSVLQDIRSLIQQTGIQIVYCERLGTTQQYITTNINDLENREIPYFSLLILKRI
ncbi:precorrin-2 C(20)-methyltransferase [Chitinophaga pinensis]|uniref:Precorrin-2 C20-methyltransferase n=1 Tax=Chitinophaga pinensis (strain ATCC 43595 / DSM 2588 / LMG 13176 / NBRC 15968 / NCIMB 11800 / UQM 2034) TaxID=485918 RepID=A0A979G6Z5_CHIPD|nr:precorrin-2 C(20)-methyltransferase [Chitinophaga pinensis]ACU61916.1 precorrin-2 C20-methyltransferase [Chitinophaga pinensis DSM 2588]